MPYKTKKLVSQFFFLPDIRIFSISYIHHKTHSCPQEEVPETDVTHNSVKAVRVERADGIGPRNAFPSSLLGLE